MSKKLIFTFENFQNLYWHGKRHSALVASVWLFSSVSPAWWWWSLNWGTLAGLWLAGSILVAAARPWMRRFVHEMRPKSRRGKAQGGDAWANLCLVQILRRCWEGGLGQRLCWIFTSVLWKCGLNPNGWKVKGVVEASGSETGPHAGATPITAGQTDSHSLFYHKAFLSCCDW